MYVCIHVSTYAFIFYQNISQFVCPQWVKKKKLQYQKFGKNTK